MDPAISCEHNRELRSTVHSRFEALASKLDYPPVVLLQVAARLKRTPCHR
jgi:hypothetical protein